MTDVEDLKKSNPCCWECKGKPDFIYFEEGTNKVLSVICTGCRNAYEGMLRGMANSYCKDPDCADPIHNQNKPYDVLN